MTAPGGNEERSNRTKARRSSLSPPSSERTLKKSSEPNSSFGSSSSAYVSASADSVIKNVLSMPPAVASAHVCGYQQYESSTSVFLQYVLLMPEGWGCGSTGVKETFVTPSIHSTPSISILLGPTKLFVVIGACASIRTETFFPSHPLPVSLVSIVKFLSESVTAAVAINEKSKDAPG